MPTLQVPLRRRLAAVIAAIIFALWTVRRTEARPVAYVPNDGDGTVAVVNVGTNAYRGSIRLCEFGDFCNLGGIAITPDGRRAYILSRETLFVIDTVANTIAGSLPFSGLDIAFTADGRRAFISGCGFGGAVCELDTRSNAVTAVISMPRGSERVAVAPQAPIAYVTATSYPYSGPGFIEVVSTTSHSVIHTVTLEGPAMDVAFNPKSHRAYAVGFPGLLSVIDTSAHVVRRTVDLGAGPRRVAFAPDGRRAYITASTSDCEQVVVIDASSDSITARVILSSGGDYGRKPLGVAVTPDGTRVYVVENEDYVVTVIDTQSLTVIGSTDPTGEGPEEIAIADVPEDAVGGGSGCNVTLQRPDAFASVILLLPVMLTWRSCRNTRQRVVAKHPQAVLDVVGEAPIRKRA